MVIDFICQNFICTCFYNMCFTATWQEQFSVLRALLQLLSRKNWVYPRASSHWAGKMSALCALLEWKRTLKNFQEHDFLRYLKFVPFSSLLRSSWEKGANFKFRKKSFLECWSNIFFTLVTFRFDKFSFLEKVLALILFQYPITITAKNTIQ